MRCLCRFAWFPVHKTVLVSEALLFQVHMHGMVCHHTYDRHFYLDVSWPRCIVTGCLPSPSLVTYLLSLHCIELCIDMCTNFSRLVDYCINSVHYAAFRALWMIYVQNVALVCGIAATFQLSNVPKTIQMAFVLRQSREARRELIQYKCPQTVLS